MSNNPWNQLTANFNVSDDSFNDVISGSKMLDVGDHENVTIIGAEPGVSKAGNGFVRFIYSNDDGQTINDRVFLLAKPDDSGVVKPHFTLRRLLAAVVKDVQLRTAFANLIKQNPAHLASLNGFKVSIKVVPAKEGYTCKRLETGGVILWDVETDKQIGDTVFEDYTAAKAAAKEAEIYAAYPKIDQMKNPSEEWLMKNEAALRTITTASAGTNNAGQAAVRTIPGGSVRKSL